MKRYHIFGQRPAPKPTKPPTPEELKAAAQINVNAMRATVEFCDANPEIVTDPGNVSQVYLRVLAALSKKAAEKPKEAASE